MNFTRFPQLLISPSLRLYFSVKNWNVSLRTFSSEAFGVETGPKNLSRLMFLFFFFRNTYFCKEQEICASNKQLYNQRLKKIHTNGDFWSQFWLPYFYSDIFYSFFYWNQHCIHGNVPSDISALSQWFHCIFV